MLAPATSPSLRVAILEDAVRQALSVAGWLERAGYRSVIRHDGNSFIRLLETEHVDVLLLDWEVPGATGIEVLRWVRERHADDLPIIMLTGHDSEDSIVQGLDCGADDYMIKPACERELIARVRAQERRYYPERLRGRHLAVGNYVLDLEARSVQVTSNGATRVVNLSAREFMLAVQLFRNIGRIVRKDDLIERIWGEIDRKYDATLATYISKLRSSLELRAKNGMVVSTVYSHGYRLEQLPSRPQGLGGPILLPVRQAR